MSISDGHSRQPRDLHDPVFLRACMQSLPAATLLAGVAFWSASDAGAAVPIAVVVSVAVFFVVEVVVAGLVLGMANTASAALTSFVAPSGGGTPSVDDYSREKALVARGAVDQALTAIEGKLAEHPNDPMLLLFAADVYARSARDPGAAARLLVRVREIKGVAREHDYAATNRLIDLYMGPLDDRARAIAELERIRARHPGTSAARGAEKALQQLRTFRH